MAEKREQQRLKKRLQIRFGQDSAKRMAFTGDVSDTGLFIITGQPAPPGSRIVFEVILPKVGPIRAVGQVRWAKKVPANLVRASKKAGMGVRIKSFEKGESVFINYLKTM